MGTRSHVSDTEARKNDQGWGDGRKKQTDRLRTRTQRYRGARGEVAGGQIHTPSAGEEGGTEEDPGSSRRRQEAARSQPRPHKPAWLRPRPSPSSPRPLAAQPWLSTFFPADSLARLWRGAGPFLSDKSHSGRAQGQVHSLGLPRLPAVVQLPGSAPGPSISSPSSHLRSPPIGITV